MGPDKLFSKTTQICSYTLSLYILPLCNKPLIYLKAGRNLLSLANELLNRFIKRRTSKRRISLRRNGPAWNRSFIRFRFHCVKPVTNLRCNHYNVPALLNFLCHFICPNCQYFHIRSVLLCFCFNAFTTIALDIPPEHTNNTFIFSFPLPLDF